MTGIHVYLYSKIVMPRASRARLPKDITEELSQHFAHLISTLQNAGEIEQFFQEFLTREEKMMLTKRLMLHMMLEYGYSSTHIESVLKVSRETVRVHRSVWSKGSAIYKKIIGKLAGRERAKVFWQKVEKILKPVDLFLRAKSDMKARAKFASGDWHA